MDYEYGVHEELTGPLYLKKIPNSPLPMYRFIRIKPVRDVNEVPELVKNSPFLKAEYLQTVGDCNA